MTMFKRHNKTNAGSKKHIFDDNGSLKILLLNNEALQEQDLDHPVTENDELWLLSIVSGG
jgi:hypothetical protein